MDKTCTLQENSKLSGTPKVYTFRPLTLWSTFVFMHTFNEPMKELEPPEGALV